MTVRLRAGGVLWLGVVVLSGCDHAAPPTVAQAEPASPAVAVPAPKPGAPFLWRLRSQSPAAKTSDVFPDVAHGRVPQQATPWTCDYSLEDTNTDGELAEQFGVLACASQTTGMRAAALVMCMTSPERPSECGTGNVQVMDAEGGEHTFSLSCATAQSDCFTRAEVSSETSDHGAVGSVGGLGIAGDADAEEDATDTPPWATWSVGMFREGFGDRRVRLEDAAGELPTVTDAWRCSYRVGPGQSADGVRAEVGKVQCVAKTGERVGTSTVCMESSDPAGFANAGALRLSGPETPDVALMLDCKTEPATSREGESRVVR